MEIITTNGQKSVKIVPASFKDASALKRAVMKIALDSNLIKNAQVINIGNIDSTGILTGLIQSIIGLDTSDEFESALMACLRVCIYDNKHSITPQLFDDVPELREDYYEIVTKCCEENLRPFFKSLVSELKTRFNQMEQSTPAIG